MKMSFLLLLCLAKFIMNLNLREDTIKKSNNEFIIYENSFKEIDPERVNAVIEELKYFDKDY